MVKPTKPTKPEGAKRIVKLSEDEYHAHCNDYDGICFACGTWSSGGVEPDACEYECEACGESEVYGAEEALLMDRIVFSDDDS